MERKRKRKLGSQFKSQLNSKWKWTFAGSLVDPAVAKLHLLWKLGAPHNPHMDSETVGSLHPLVSRNDLIMHLRLWRAVEGTCSLPLHQGSSLTVHACHLHNALHAHWASRIFSGLEISCGARKLARTPRVT
jgi:hypothetical protein